MFALSLGRGEFAVVDRAKLLGVYREEGLASLDELEERAWARAPGLMRTLRGAVDGE